MPHLRSVSMGVWLGSGSRDEDAEANGISHFVEHMVFKGTTTRSAQQFAREVDAIGGNLDAFTGKETVCFNIKVLDENVPLALDLLTDLVLHPTFDAGGHRAGAGRDPGRDQDGRGQPRLPGARDLYAELLEGRCAGAADPGDGEDGFELRPAASCSTIMRGGLRRRTWSFTAAGNLEHDSFVAQVDEAFASLAARRTTACARTAAPTSASAHYAEEQEVAGAGAVLPWRCRLCR